MDTQAGFKHKPSPVLSPIPKVPFFSSLSVQNIMEENNTEDEDVQGRCQPWIQVEETLILILGVKFKPTDSCTLNNITFFHQQIS